MRLGINGQRLSGQRLGVGRYIEYMVRYWDQMLKPGDQITLYLKEPLDGNALPLSNSWNVKVLRSSLNGIFWEHLVLARQAKKVDVLFCPSYTVPLNYKGKCVVANHSVNEVQSKTHPWWYHLTFKQRYRLSARKADVVVVPSESTKEDLEREYGIPSDKLEVIWLGVDEGFRKVDDPSLLRQTRLKFIGEDRPYILFVGKLSQRRNIPNLVAAFAKLKRDGGIPHCLLLVGPNHLSLPLERLATDFGITDSLVQTDGRFADHHELVAVYNAADLFVHPSSYEGFSLPVLEAMACGLPVVTVNRSALSEIAADCAVLVDEPSAEALTEAMQRVLADPSLREDLSARGMERARSFRWEDTARRTLDVLRRVAGEGPQ